MNISSGSSLSFGKTSSSSSSGGGSYNIKDDSDTTFMQVDINENVAIGKLPSGAYKLDVLGNVNASNYFKNGIEIQTLQGISSTASQSGVIQLSNNLTTFNNAIYVNRDLDDDTPALTIQHKNSSSNTTNQTEILRLISQSTATSNYNQFFGPSINFHVQAPSLPITQLATIAAVNDHPTNKNNGALWFYTNKLGSSIRRMIINDDGCVAIGHGITQPSTGNIMFDVHTSANQGFAYPPGRVQLYGSTVRLTNSGATSTCTLTFDQTNLKLDISRPVYVTGDIFANTSQKVATEAYVNSVVTTGSSNLGDKILQNGYSFVKDVNNTLNLNSTETNKKFILNMPFETSNDFSTTSNSIVTLNGNTNLNKVKTIVLDNNASNASLKFKSADGTKEVKLEYDSGNNIINLTSTPTGNASLSVDNGMKAMKYELVSVATQPSGTANNGTLRLHQNNLYFTNSQKTDILATKSYVDSLSGVSSNLALTSISTTPSATTEMIKLGVNSSSNAQSGYGVSQGYYIDDPNVAETQIGKIEFKKRLDDVGNKESELSFHTHNGTNLYETMKINSLGVDTRVKSDFSIRSSTYPNSKYFQFGLDSENAYTYLDIGCLHTNNNTDYDCRIGVERYSGSGGDGKGILRFFSGSTEFYCNASEKVLSLSNTEIQSFEPIVMNSNKIILGNNADKNQIYTSSNELNIVADNKINLKYMVGDTETTAIAINKTGPSISFNEPLIMNNKQIILGSSDDSNKIYAEGSHINMIAEDRMYFKYNKAGVEKTAISINETTDIHVYDPISMKYDAVGDRSYTFKLVSSVPSYITSNPKVFADLELTTNTSYTSENNNNQETAASYGAKLKLGPGMALDAEFIRLRRRTYDLFTHGVGSMWMNKDQLRFWGYDDKIKRISSTNVGTDTDIRSYIFTSGVYDDTTKSVVFKADPDNSTLSDVRIQNNQPVTDADIQQIHFRVYNDNILSMKKTATIDTQVNVKGTNTALFSLGTGLTENVQIYYEKPNSPISGGLDAGMNLSVNGINFVNMDYYGGSQHSKFLGKVKINGTLYADIIDTNQYTELYLKAGNANKLSLHNDDVILYENLRPSSHNVFSLGSEEYAFSQGYISSLQCNTINSPLLSMNIGGNAESHEFFSDPSASNVSIRNPFESSLILRETTTNTSTIMTHDNTGLKMKSITGGVDSNLLSINSTRILVHENILPNANGTLDIGDSSQGFRDLRVRNLVASVNGNIHLCTQEGTIRMGITNSQIGITLPLRPSISNTTELGGASLMFSNCHTNNINANNILRLQTDSGTRVQIEAGAVRVLVPLTPQLNGSASLGTSLTRFSNCYLQNAVDISSDSRKKNSIQRINIDCLNMIKHIDGKEYKLNDIENDDLRYGFVVQDFLQYLQSKSIDPLSLSLINQDEDGFYSMRYQELIGVLWNGLKQVDDKLNLMNPNQSQDLLPLYETGCNLGSADKRWDNIYYNNLISPSDMNLKDNIENCILGLEFLKSIEPVTYTWKQNSHGRKHAGYIAQSVESSLNKFGLDMKDWALIGKVNGEYHLKYLEFIPILHNAILEVNNRLDAYALNQEIKSDLVKLDEVKRRDSNYSDCISSVTRKVEILEESQLGLVEELQEVLQNVKLENEILRNENEIMKEQVNILQNEMLEMKDQIKLLMNKLNEPQMAQQTNSLARTTGSLKITQRTNGTLKSSQTQTTKKEGGLFGAWKS